MSSTPDLVRFPWCGQELVGTVVDSDFDPRYNAQDTVRLSVDVSGVRIAVDSSQVVEV